MKRIVGIIQPFDAKQNFYIYEGDNLIHSQKIPMHLLTETIFDLCKKYEVNDITLKGPIQYLNGLNKQITNYNFSHHNLVNNLKINLE